GGPRGASHDEAMTLHENDPTDPTACIDYVVSKFPFRIQSIRTDRGHEFQALFHWHVADPCRNTSTSNRERHSAMGGRALPPDQQGRVLPTPQVQRRCRSRKKLAVGGRFDKNDRPPGA
ncbi:MAG: hypothetical protein QMC73_04845, partial [Myxococcota bacterium]